MMLTEMSEHVSLYMTPLNIDPENPAMPISHPSYYATYLAKKIGPFATLGLAEDTWALNEGVIDDDTFLQMAYDIDRERQEMFMATLDRQRGGRSPASSTRPTASSTCSGATSRRATRRRRATREARTRTRSRSSTSTTMPSWAGHGQASRGRPAHGPLRSRLHLLPPRGQPERLAAGARLLGAEAGKGREGGVAAATWTGRRRAPMRSAWPASTSTSAAARRRASWSRGRGAAAQGRAGRPALGPAGRGALGRGIRELFDTSKLYRAPTCVRRPTC